MNFEEAEKIDGVRLAWNVWPTTRLEAVKLVLPLGVLYTPLIRPDDIVRCNYRPIACRNQKCGSILSPWCEEDTTHQIWVCPLCLTRNAFPPSYNGTEKYELQQDATTIEYEPQSEGTGSPAFLFVVDTAVEESELEQIKASIQQALTLLPTDAMIGLITYGKHVSVHEIGFTDCAKTIVFRGDVSEDRWATMNVERVKSLLEIDAQNENSILRFLQPLQQIEDTFNQILEDVRRDPWPAEKACRAPRSTGVASLVGVALLEAALQGYSARMMLFTGGPPTMGPGMVVKPPKADRIRGYRDIVKGKAPYYDRACKFYADLARHAVANGHVIDLFACSLDQMGVAEQRVLVDKTGGILVMSDTFTKSVFMESFSSLFIANATEELSMAFNTEIKVRTSRQIKVSGCLGPVAAMSEMSGDTHKGDKSSNASNADDKSTSVSANEVGIGGTSRWSVGGVYPNTTLCFVLDIAANQMGEDEVNEHGYIQFQTSYRTSYGTDVIRVTTIGVQFANAVKKDGLDMIVGGFDQEAAAVIMARMATHKADSEFEPDLMRWLDHQIIKLVTKFATFTSGDTDSFALPDEFLNFPQFMFYLRRSQFLRLTDYSPDEMAYFRATLTRENVCNSMTMIQPLLHTYTMADESNTAVPVLLELSSRHPDCILLLDSFFHLVIWYGRNIAAWRDEKVDEDPTYAWFADLLQSPKDDAYNRAVQRFPYPNIIQCDEASGQQRFLIAKLNPDNTAAEQHYDEAQQTTGDVWTDDVSLKVFMTHLKRLAVNPP